MTAPAPRCQPKISAARRSALERFAASKVVIPQFAEIRKDVARALFDAGYVKCLRENDNFRGGYAPLKITDAGRAALQSEKTP